MLLTTSKRLITDGLLSPVCERDIALIRLIPMDSKTLSMVRTYLLFWGSFELHVVLLEEMSAICRDRHQILCLL